MSATPGQSVNGEALTPAQRVLISRIGRLREYVVRKIPRRFARLISPDDVLQEIWIAAHAKFEEVFANAGDPAAIDRWLMIVARNRLIDILRAVRCPQRNGAAELRLITERRMTTYSSLFDRLSTRARTPSQTIRAVEAAHTVGITLRGLSDERRQVIELRFLDGMSHREIAQVLNKSEAAVNSLLFQGLRDLRTRLGDAARFLSSA